MTFPIPSDAPVADASAVGSLSRHLPSGCTIRRAIAGDAERVAGLLREADRQEMEALEGRPALAVLQEWMSGASRVLIAHGDAVAIFGITACTVHGADSHDKQHGEQHQPRAATPWVAMASTLDHEDLVDVLWLSRFQVDAWQRRWPVLLTVCDMRNRFRGQWLDWLGFERRGRVERFGAAGIPFDLHVRLRVLQ
jgi:hypothetical protein